MQFICYPKCTTCQKARKWLDEHHISYTLRDIKLERPGLEELKAWYLKSGYSLWTFFNTSGISYRALGGRAKVSSLNEEERLRLLSEDGMLVKRPLLISDELVLVGFRQAEWEEKLL